MSVTASPAQTAPNPACGTAGCCAALGPVPLLLLFGSGALWFLVGMFFALLASLKFHNPHFLADHAFWTYGRVHAAHVDSLLYGFGVQVAMGTGIWLFRRLGRATVVGAPVVVIGTALWNTALAVGILGVLCGDSTGYDSFELPRYVTVMLLLAYLMMATCALLTFSARTEMTLYPSQWFVLGSLFWFPWIFSTASALLLCMPARGVVQAVIAWWYAHNFNTVFLGFAGLASILYFVPKLLGRPLHSYYLAALGFWTLALFGSCGGIPFGAPVPSWIVSISAVGTFLTAIPILAIALNFLHTVRHDLDAMDSNLPVRFAYVSLLFWVIASAQAIVGVVPHVTILTDFTWFSVAQWELFHYGFFALAMFGAIYYILPRVLNANEPPEWSIGLIKAHFWFTFFGILIAYIALIVGGVGQGFLLNDPKYAFTEVIAGTLTALRAETLGDLLILIGAIFFMLNLALLLSRQCAQCIARLGFGIGKERP